MTLLIKIITILVCKITSNLYNKMWHHSTYHLTSVIDFVKLWSWAGGEVPGAKYCLSWLSRLSRFRHHPDFCVYQKEKHQSSTLAEEPGDSGNTPTDMVNMVQMREGNFW